MSSSKWSYVYDRDGIGEGIFGSRKRIGEWIILFFGAISASPVCPFTFTSAKEWLGPSRSPKVERILRHWLVVGAVNTSRARPFARSTFCRRRSKEWLRQPKPSNVEVGAQRRRCTVHGEVRLCSAGHGDLDGRHGSWSPPPIKTFGHESTTERRYRGLVSVFSNAE